MGHIASEGRQMAQEEVKRRLIGFGLWGLCVLYIIGIWSIRHQPEFRESVMFPYVMIGLLVVVMGFVWMAFIQREEVRTLGKGR